MIEPDDHGRSRGRPKRDDAANGREKLLAAATEAFARHGFEGADLRGIAAMAGVTSNLIRVHFGSKADLWAACVEALATAMVPGVAAVTALADDTARPLAERLKDGIRVTAAFYEAHPAIRDFVARVTTEAPERAGPLAERLLVPPYDAGRPLIVAGIEAGMIRAGHPALFFVLLNSALSQPAGFPALLHRIAPDIAAGEARARLSETIVETLLDLPRAPEAPARRSPHRPVNTGDRS